MVAIDLEQADLRRRQAEQLAERLGLAVTFPQITIRPEAWLNQMENLLKRYLKKEILSCETTLKKNDITFVFNPMSVTANGRDMMHVVVSVPKSADLRALRSSLQQDGFRLGNVLSSGDTKSLKVSCILDFPSID